MSEAAFSSSPTKSLSSWWRNFKTASREGDGFDMHPSHFYHQNLRLPLSESARPGLRRSSASSSAITNAPYSPSKATSKPQSQNCRDFGIAVPPQYMESPIFGTPLKVSLRYANVKISLTDHSGSNFVYGHVPIIIAKCAVFLKQKARETEGIFRIPGSVRRIKMLQDLFNTPPTFGKDLEWTGFMVHDAANLLKRYLAMLPDPIIPRYKYKAFRDPLQRQFVEIRDFMSFNSVSQASQIQNHGNPLSVTTPPPKPSPEQVNAAVTIYENLIFALPKSSRQLLLYLIDLLSVFAAQSSVNRMTAYNLAAVFQPSVLTIKEHDMNPEELQTSQLVLEFLITNSVELLTRVQKKAILVHEQKESGQEVVVGEGVRDYSPLDEKPVIPPLMVSAPDEAPATLRSESSDISSFQRHLARRHSKSLSSAISPNLQLQEQQPRVGFLRRQISNSRASSASSSRAVLDVPEDAEFINPQSTTDPAGFRVVECTETTTSRPPQADEERKSRFRRSLMVLLPSREDSSREASPTRPEMKRSLSWFARFSGKEHS